jgi:hypothetical protein
MVRLLVTIHFPPVAIIGGWLAVRSFPARVLAPALQDSPR